MQNPDFYLHASQMLIYSTLAFILALWWAPVLIQALKKLKFWKKVNKIHAVNGEELSVTKKFYEENDQKSRGGGILIWGTVLFIAFFFWVFLKLNPDDQLTQFLNFVDRTQTFIPLGVLFFASLLGLIDDILAVLPNGGNYFAGGLKLSHRLIGVLIIAITVGWWFHFKIGEKMHTITLPWFNASQNSWYKLNLNEISLPLGWLDNFFGYFNLETTFVLGGWLIIPITVLVLSALWSSAVIDGFDGISVGVLIPIYLAFTGLAFATEQYNIATFMMVMVGAMAGYLWHNIPPAKFFLGDNGIQGLLFTLGVVAMLLDKIYVLPIAGIVLVATSLSVVIQILSKKFRKGKKVFLAAPLHHHFEAKGWLRHQVTMRYWLVSIMASVLGFAVGLIIV